MCSCEDRRRSREEGELESKPASRRKGGEVCGGGASSREREVIRDGGGKNERARDCARNG